jgi:hypothetical protein
MENQTFARGPSTERGAHPGATYVLTEGADRVLYVVADCRGDVDMAARIVQALNDRPNLLRTIGRLLRELDGCRGGRSPEDLEAVSLARQLVA